MDEKYKRFADYDDETPMYSRLFIVCDKNTTENEFREVFSKFGEIEDIRMPMNDAGVPKGVCFIKFVKTTQAARALEAMHMKPMPNSTRLLKVLVAVNRSDVPHTDKEPHRYQRLFIHVSRTVKEDELEEEFQKYGTISGLVIQRDHNSGESRGFAYVTYTRFSEAARAMEECPKHYRPIFAKPREQKRMETPFVSEIDMLTRSSSNRASMLSMIAPRPGNYTSINFICSPCVTHRQMEALFDLVPGMTRCKFYVDLVRNIGKGTVMYSNHNSAAYAVDKLNEFQYPPNMMVFVKPDLSSNSQDNKEMQDIPAAVNNLQLAIESSSKTPDLAQLTQAVAEATRIIQLATGEVTDKNAPSSLDLNYCSVSLPPPQPLADIDSPLAKRCFLICKPAPPPLTVLRDVFCRFGDLINVYTLPNKTVGYARYASAGAADEAIRTLHGAEICGVRIKVIEAEAEAPPRKRRYEN